MIVQKIIQVGNSLAVTLPASFVKSKKVKPGQKVYVEADPNTDTVQVRTKKGEGSMLTPEFFVWLNKFNARYKNALSELAKK